MRSTFLILFVLLCSIVQGQTQKPKEIYSVSADAEADVAEAVRQAGQNGKHVLLMFGGNWCRWCRMYEKFRIENAVVDSASRANFVFVHVNYSKENKNNVVLESMEYPQRFGFPVFVVLDGKGKRLHTQNSAYLEDGEGYSVKKVLEFYAQWSPKSLDPASYR